MWNISYFSVADAKSLNINRFKSFCNLPYLPYLFLQKKKIINKNTMLLTIRKKKRTQSMFSDYGSRRLIYFISKY